MKKENTIDAAELKRQLEYARRVMLPSSNLYWTALRCDSIFWRVSKAALL